MSKDKQDEKLLRDEMTLPARKDDGWLYVVTLRDGTQEWLGDTQRLENVDARLDASALGKRVRFSGIHYRDASGKLAFGYRGSVLASDVLGLVYLEAEHLDDDVRGILGLNDPDLDDDEGDDDDQDDDGVDENPTGSAPPSGGLATPPSGGLKMSFPKS